MVRSWFFASLLILIYFPLEAQGLFEGATAEAGPEDQPEQLLSLSGYARGAAHLGGDDYDYGALFGEFSLRGRLAGEGAFLFADVRFRDGLFFNERQSLVEVREAYAGLRWNNADIFLGNQIVSWGRTDGFNPTDNINPRNYFFLSPEPDDQLIGNFMIRSRIRPVRNTELEVIAIPYYKPSVYRYELFDMGYGVRFAGTVLPEAGFRNGAVAARFNVELPSIGFSFSFFSGYDPFYGFSLEEADFLPEPDIEYRPRVYRKDAPGIDMALPVRSWIIRFESALNLTKDYADNMHIPNPDLYLVGGLERDIAGFNAIIQYLGRYVIDYEPLAVPVLTDINDPEALYRYAIEMVHYESALYNRRIFQQQEEFNHALFMNLSRSFFYEEIRTEFSAWYNFTSEEYFIRPGVDWYARDGLRISAGAFFMKGPEGSVYDMAGKVLGGLFLGLRMAF